MDETELIERGWRRCAAGQRTTQWCAQAEEQRQRDEALLRQALEALEQIATDLPWELTGLQADTIAALRERLRRWPGSTKGPASRWPRSQEADE